MAFVNSPLTEQPVTAVPGIGVVAAGKMAWTGITKASQLLGIYLQNPLNFQARLLAEFRVNSNHAGIANNALREMAFMNSQLEENPVTAVPGIGCQAAQNMIWMGITKASQLLGIYLQNPLNFQARLWAEFRVNSHHAGIAYNALREMVSKYMSMQTHFYCFDTAFVNSPLGERSVTALPDSPLGERSVTALPDSPLGERSVTALPDSPLGERSVTALPDSPLGERSVTALPDSPLGERPVTALPDNSYRAAQKFTEIVLAVYLQDPLNFQAKFWEKLAGSTSRDPYEILCEFNN